MLQNDKCYTALQLGITTIAVQVKAHSRRTFLSFYPYQNFPDRFPFHFICIQIFQINSDFLTCPLILSPSTYFRQISLSFYPYSNISDRFPSHFIHIQIFQIDFPLILSISKYFRQSSLSFYTFPNISDRFPSHSTYGSFSPGRGK